MFAAVEMSNEAIAVIGGAYGVLWAAFQWNYRGRIAELREHNAYLRDMLARVQAVKCHLAPPTPPNDPEEDTPTHTGPIL